MDEMITIPRSVLEQLVDPEDVPYGGYRGGDWHEVLCNYCSVYLGEWIGGNIGDGARRPETHETNCPVRLAQEALWSKETGYEQEPL